MGISNIFKECALNIYDSSFCEKIFLFKAACLIEESPKFKQEKTTNPYSPY